MNIKKLNEQLLNLLEMANSEECGKEVTKEMIDEYNQKEKDHLNFNNLQDKIKFLVYKMENSPRNKIYGLKVSNIRPINWYNPITNKKVNTNITICLGQTDKNNIVIENSRYGLYHMKYGKKQHWGLSKQCLLNINMLLQGTIYPIKRGIHKNDPTYIDIVKDKHVYGVGLAHSTRDNETVLITCFVKTSKNT